MHGEIIKFEIGMAKSKKIGIADARINTWQLRHWDFSASIIIIFYQ